MAVTYTATHSTGAVKVRKSKAHAAPRYTHALWARAEKADYYPGLADGQWHCRSIGQEATVRMTADQYRKAGWDIEIVPVQAT